MASENMDHGEVKALAAVRRCMTGCGLVEAFDEAKSILGVNKEKTMASMQCMGFAITWNEEAQAFAITLEGRHVAYTPSQEAGVASIEFYHAASSLAFSLSREREVQAREAQRKNPGPEPTLQDMKPWVDWYRGATGCGLKEAVLEFQSRKGSA